ncbi:MAG: hypothetical protein ACK5PZ_08145, partial [Pirellula sp.]
MQRVQRTRSTSPLCTHFCLSAFAETINRIGAFRGFQDSMTGRTVTIEIAVELLQVRQREKG